MRSLILLSAAALVFWQRALERPTAAACGCGRGMSILAVLTHYFAAFLFLAEAVCSPAAGGVGPRSRRLARCCSSALALAPLALRQRADGKSNWIEARLAGIAHRRERQAVPRRPLRTARGASRRLLAALLAAGAVALLLR